MTRQIAQLVGHQQRTPLAAVLPHEKLQVINSKKGYHNSVSFTKQLPVTEKNQVGKFS
jgi:hypothetical protein